MHTYCGGVNHMLASIPFAHQWTNVSSSKATCNVLRFWLVVTALLLTGRLTAKMSQPKSHFVVTYSAHSMITMSYLQAGVWLRWWHPGQ
jgi:hypothetical protein